MYYNQETIESELECKLCKNQFNDPRLLPCGNTCCLSCIISISIEDGEFKCPCCELKHKKSILSTMQSLIC
jgi:PHP family Zn ribbon phosphoesterase